MDKYSLRNLVVLRYCTNSCYVEVLSLSKLKKDKLAKTNRPNAYNSLEVNVTEGTWSFGGGTQRIGSGSHIGGTGEDVNPELLPIGIYDKRKISHLNSMANIITDIMRKS